MSERPKGSEIDQQTAVAQGQRRQVAASTGRRSQVRVGADHKTDATKKGKRGTYP